MNRAKMRGRWLLGHSAPSFPLPVVYPGSPNVSAWQHEAEGLVRAGPSVHADDSDVCLVIENSPYRAGPYGQGGTQGPKRRLLNSPSGEGDGTQE